MKLSELSRIMHLLPGNLEVQIIGDMEQTPEHLKYRTWGNHDGRYNMECIKCG